MEEIGGGQAGPFEDLEVIRVEAGMSTSRFCDLIDMPERTWRRWQAKAKDTQPPAAPISSAMAFCKAWLWASASGAGTGRLSIASAKSDDFTA